LEFTDKDLNEEIKDMCKSY